MSMNRIVKSTSLSVILLYLFLTSCNLFSPGLGETVDITAPVVTITSPASDTLEYKNAPFEITGSVVDDIALSRVEIEWPGGSGNVTITDNTWTVTVDPSDITSRGSVLFTATAYDKSGKESSPYNVNIVIDDVAPTVVIDTPSTYGPGPQNSDYIVIEGDVWDSTDVSLVTVNVYHAGTPSVPLVSQDADGTSSFSARVSLDESTFANGDSYYYEVIAQDKAGNTNSYVYHSADFWSILPSGNLFPSSSDIGQWDQDGTALVLEVGDGAVLFDDTVKASMQLTQDGISGDLDFTFNADQDVPVIELSNLDADNAAEDNALGQNVPIYASATDDKEGIDTDTVSLHITGTDTDLTIGGSEFSSPGDGLYTSFQFDLTDDYTLEPGFYAGTITLADLKGTESTSVFSFLVDKGAPVINSMSPSTSYAGTEVDGSLITLVEIQDDNSGATLEVEAYYSDGTAITGITTEVAVAESTLVENDETYYVSTWRGTIPAPVPDELELEVTVVDSTGLRNTRSQSLTIDTDLPTLTIVVPGAGSSISGNAVTAAGTADDSGSNVYQVFVALAEGSLSEAPSDSVWSAAEGNTTWSLPVDLSVYNEGAFSLFAYPVDMASNQGDTSYVNFYFDVADPVLTLDGGNDEVAIQSELALTGSTTDSNGIASFDIQYSLDGADPVSVAGYPVTSFSDPTDYDWAYTVPADGDGSDDGYYVYTFISTDIAGKTDEITKQIQVDTQPPIINVTNLSDGDSIETDSYTIRGTAMDDSGISLVEYNLNDTGWTAVTGTISWSQAVNGLEEGSGNTILFRSTDIAGLTSDPTSISFGLDLSAPDLEIDAADLTAYTDQYALSTFALNGTASDENGILKLEISTDGGITYTQMESSPGTPYESSDNTTIDWSTDVEVPADGSEDGNHTVRVKATDTYNKESILTFNMKFDATAPTFTVINLVNDQLLSSTSYNVAGTWSDNGGSGTDSADGAYVEFSTDSGSSWTSFSTTESTWNGNIALAQGQDHDVWIRAVDAVGNQSSTSQFSGIDVDTDLPVLSETLINSEDQQVSDASVTFGGYATDTNELSFLRVAVNEGTFQAISVDANGPDDIAGNSDDGYWTFTHPNTTDGSFSLVFTATDVAGQTATVERNLLIDTLSPVISIELPPADEYLTGSSYTARGTVTDANSLSSVEYRTVTGGTPTSWLAVSGTESWSQSLNLLSLGSGDHILEIQAEDFAGHVSTASSDFRVDLVSPTVSETGFGASSGYINEAFSLSGTLTDDVDIASLTVTQSQDGGAASIIYSTAFAAEDNTSESWTVTNLPDGGVTTGQYEYVITVTDSADKVSTLTRTVTVDNDAPHVEITSLLPMQTGNEINGVVTLSVNATDAYGMEEVKYFLRTDATIPDFDDGDGITLSSPYSVNIDSETDLSNSTSYSLYVIGRDKGGNESTSSMTFTVNQASDVPSGEITSPLDGSQLGADNRIRGTFSDDDGVAAEGAVLHIRLSGGSWTSESLDTASTAGQLVSWSYDATDFVTAEGDGTYEIYLTVTDDDSEKLGKSSESYSTAQQSFGYDQNNPDVSAVSVSPVSDAYADGDVLTFSWTASDDSGLDSQTVTIDGSTDDLGSITNPSGDNYQVVYTVPSSGTSSGYRTFTLIAEDTYEKTTTRTSAFLIDVDDPVVESSFSLDPSFVGFTPNGQFEIGGTASDNLGLASIEIELADSLAGLDGSSWTAAALSGGVWSFDLDSSTIIPASGTLYFQVRATDDAGNVSTAINFTQAVDQSADLASVSILSPVDSTTYGTTVQISGTASDDDDLYDFDDNSVIDADAIEIDYDTVPTSGSWTTVNPTISGSGGNASWNYSLDSLSGGDYQVRARARDDSGTWGDYSSTVEFTVNAGAPNFILSTTVDNYRNNSTIALSGTVEDSDGVTDVRVRVNSGSWNTVSAGSGSWSASNTSDTWSYSLGLGTDGLKTVELQAEDSSGFISNEQFTTRVDTTMPTGGFDSLFQDNPTGSYISTDSLNGEISISGTVEELNLVDSDSVQIRIAEWNGLTEENEVLSYTTVTGTYVWSHVWDTSSLDDRQYILQLKIEDQAGNVTDTITQVVTTDQSADDPQISQAFLDASLPADAGTNVLQSSLKISGTLTDDDGFDSGAVNIYLDGSATAINGSNTTGTTGTWEYTWTSLSEGQHYLTLEATDRNSNVVTLGPTYFLVDTANPTLSITSPEISAKINEGTLIISGDASDGGGLDSDSLEIVLDHSDNSSPLDGVSYYPVVGGDTFSQSITIDDTTLDGTLTLYLSLTDRAGKQTSVSRAVTIDTTSPSLALNYPSAEAYINGLISFEGTGDDLNGLSDVTLQILDPDTKSPVTTLSRTSDSLAAWEFQFNSDSYSTSTYGTDVNGDGTLWQIYFRLAAEDNSGNVTEYLTGDPADYPYIFIDTDGDKPSISITQPKNGDTIGGFVNMYGTATDDDGAVMQVEVRIDYNGDGDFADSMDINGDGSTTLGSDQDFLGNTVRVGDSDEMWEDESAWYLVDVSNSSWSQDLNMSNELYASNTGGTGDIVIQVRTRDMFGLASEVIERTITLDETFPRIENISPDDQSYQNGLFSMYAEFGDNEQLNLSDTSIIGINVNKSGYEYFTAASPELTANASNGYDMSYDIDTDTYFSNSSGILYVDLYVKDQAEYQNQTSYTFYVDNQDPTSTWSDRSGAPDGSNLSNGMITVNGTDRTYIEGNYEDSGTVNGISHMEVFFLDSSGEIRNIQASGSLATGAYSTETIDVETYDLDNNVWTDSTASAPVITNDDLGDDYVVKVDYSTEMSSLTLGTDVDGDGYEEYLGVVDGSPVGEPTSTANISPMESWNATISYTIWRATLCTGCGKSSLPITVRISIGSRSVRILIIPMAFPTRET